MGDISGWYCIYPKHHTDAASILMCSKYTAQLACPMCYQFVLLLNVPGPPGSALQHLVGQMNDVPFANTVSRIASVVIVLLCICNFFNLYSLAVQKLGLESFDFETFDLD